MGKALIWDLWPIVAPSSVSGKDHMFIFQLLCRSQMIVLHLIFFYTFRVFFSKLRFFWKDFSRQGEEGGLKMTHYHHCFMHQSKNTELRDFGVRMDVLRHPCTQVPIGQASFLWLHAPQSFCCCRTSPCRACPPLQGREFYWWAAPFAWKSSLMG